MVVADVGCGTGVLGLMAVKAGASRVYAIDNASILRIAERTFQLAGLADRITCVSATVAQAVLPEMVDVILCDHVGYFGFDYGITTLLQDCRRLLKPCGSIIPRHLDLSVAAVETDQWQIAVAGWRIAEVPPEFHWIAETSANTLQSVRLSREGNEFLARPQLLGRIELDETAGQARHWTATLRVSRNGTMHGLAGWFNCVLAGDIAMTNAPMQEDAIRRPQAFMALAEPIDVRIGDKIHSRVLARPDEQIIAWTIEHEPSGKRASHSTWSSLPLGPEDSLRTKPDHVPRLKENGEAIRTVLESCDGERSVDEIIAAVKRKHANLLPSETALKHFVYSVLAGKSQ
jgi:protein arginine N-methyltransferase 1